MGALFVITMLAAVDPQLEAALQKAVMRSPARVELVSWEGPRCKGEFVPAPFENSGRVAVRVKGQKCEAWGWAMVKVIVPLAKMSRDVRTGELMDGAWALEESDRADEAVVIPPGALAARPLKRGASIRSADFSSGPRAGTAITVRVVAGSLAIEQRATAIACSAASAGQACATLPTGKRVAGTWNDGILTVGAM